jgi:hypothetical protein
MDERSTEPPRFQYRVINIGSFTSVARMQQALGESGKDGWELISVYDKSSNWFIGLEKGFMLFKRSVARGTTLRPEEWCETYSFEGTTSVERDRSGVVRSRDEGPLKPKFTKKRPSSGLAEREDPSGIGVRTETTSDGKTETTTYTRKDRPKVEDSTDSTNRSAWLDEGSLDDPHYQKEER